MHRHGKGTSLHLRSAKSNESWDNFAWEGSTCWSGVWIYRPHVGEPLKLESSCRCYCNLLRPTALKWEHLFSNSEGETLSSVTLTKAPEIPRGWAQRPEELELWIYLAAPGCERVWMWPSSPLVNNNTFLSEAWSPSNLGPGVSDESWLLAGSAGCHAQAVPPAPLGALSCQWSRTLNR